MLYVFNNGTGMEVVRADGISKVKHEEEWWTLLDNHVEIKDGFALNNQDIITCKYKERLAQKLTSLGYDYNSISYDLKHVTK